MLSLIIRPKNIHIHNNVPWDWQYSMEYSNIFPTFSLNVPWNIVMDLNSVTGIEESIQL